MARPGGRAGGGRDTGALVAVWGPKCAHIAGPDASQSLRMLGRAERLLPDGHGRVTVRGDSGLYAVELMNGLRKRGMRLTLSATRTSTMWTKLADIPESAWVDAIEMRGAQVAELAFTPDGWGHEPLRLIVRRVPVTAAELLQGSPKARRRKTIAPGQLQMVLDGQLDSSYGDSFVVTDIPPEEKSTAEVELFHRRRAQIEERFKDAKLGQALRHLPSGKLAANRLWLSCSLLALNVCASLCDISPAVRYASTLQLARTPMRLPSRSDGRR